MRILASTCIVYIIIYIRVQYYVRGLPSPRASWTREVRCYSTYGDGFCRQLWPTATDGIPIGGVDNIIIILNKTTHTYFRYKSERESCAIITDQWHIIVRRTRIRQRAFCKKTERQKSYRLFRIYNYSTTNAAASPKRILEQSSVM